MDTVENYQLHRHRHNAALAGLLRCLGDFTAERSPCIFRCCIPAEKYHVLMSLSQNPLKDFAGGLLLHWDAGELVQLSAKRYATYLKHYEPYFYAREIDSLDLGKREHAFAFWKKILPHEITNLNGFTESPIAYILRHTQLLPRHFLWILSNILSISILRNSNTYANIRNEDIVGGIRLSERLISTQILEAYQSSDLPAVSACEQVIKELNTKFGWSEFDAVVAKRQGDLEDYNRGEIMQTLIEIGAIGRVIGETRRYYIAIFEYMVPHRLLVRETDSFCVHPVFTETYQAKSRYEGAKPIYTYWSQEIPEELV
jgi:hypothetical protein